MSENNNERDIMKNLINAILSMKIKDKKIQFNIHVVYVPYMWEKNLGSHEWSECLGYYEDYRCIRCGSVLIQTVRDRDFYNWPENIIDETCGKIVMDNILR